MCFLIKSFLLEDLSYVLAMNHININTTVEMDRCQIKMIDRTRLVSWLDMVVYRDGEIPLPPLNPANSKRYFDHSDKGTGPAF